MIATKTALSLLLTAVLLIPMTGRAITSATSPSPTALPSPTASPSPTALPSPAPGAGPNILPGGCSPTCDGVFGAFSNQSYVDLAYSGNWFPANQAGQGQCGVPYTSSLNTDQYVYNDIKNNGGDWLSFWTVKQAGLDAGKAAALEMHHVAGSSNVEPTYFVIDEEGNTLPSTAQQFQDLAQGFAIGVRIYGKAFGVVYSGALYASQSQYKDYNLSSLNIPAFVAVNPIPGNTPFVSGGTIKGYSGYYASCSDSPPDASADAQQVNSWGGSLNTLQFHDSGVDCPL